MQDITLIFVLSLNIKGKENKHSKKLIKKIELTYEKFINTQN